MNPDSWNARIRSPLKSLIPMKPSRSLVVGRFMQWNDTNRPGIVTRYSSSTRNLKWSMNSSSVLQLPMSRSLLL